MKRSIVSFAASAFLVGLLSAAPANAALITFVSGNGNDSNDCLSPGTACRQVSFALTQTDPTGTVHVLPGEYDTFAVDKSLDIIAEPGTATIGNHIGTPVPGGGLASILVEGDVIVRIQGFHIYNPTRAIVSLNAEVLHVEDCVIVPGGSAFGIDARITSATRELYVSNTIITGDGSPGGGGIVVTPSGSGGAKVVLDNVSVEDSVLGILVEGRFTTGSNNVVIRNSTVAGSTAFGVSVVDAGGGSTKAVVESTTIAGNATQGLGAYGANTTVRVKDSTISGNGVGLDRSGAQLISHGGNAVADNTTNGSFSSTVVPQ